MSDLSYLPILQKLLFARGPCGQEDEVSTVCKELFEGLVDEVWVDSSDNVVGKIKGTDGGVPALGLFLHMDELSMIVKRVNSDGTLRLEPLGGLFPANMGQGMVEIMGDHAIIPGVFSFGSMHTTPETKSVNKQVAKVYGGDGKSPSWEDVYVLTRKTKEELEELGVRAGTRVVIAQNRREVQEVGDCLAGYFLDNRAAITIGIEALKLLKEKAIRPQSDLYIVATTSEEIGALGASFAAKELPIEVALAVDVGPVAKEYLIELSDEPIIIYKDSRIVYDKKISDTLLQLGKKLGYKPQAACLGRYGSDASIAKMYGQVARNALICIPTENTHGYEVIHKRGITKSARLLAEYFIL